MPAVLNSILDDTKKALGLAWDYAAFDSEIIMHINSVLADLNQLGVGPADGLIIVNSSDTWDELIASEKRLNHVKSYIHLRVKMLWDPPTVGYVLTSMEKMIEKAEWRVMVAQDEILNPTVVTTVSDTTDPFDNF